MLMVKQLGLPDSTLPVLSATYRAWSVDGVILAIDEIYRRQSRNPTVSHNHIGHRSPFWWKF